MDIYGYIQNRLIVCCIMQHMFAPNIQQTEALKDEIETFIEQIKNSSFISINDMNKGKEVVQLLEYSDVSLKNNKIVNL